VMQETSTMVLLRLVGLVAFCLTIVASLDFESAVEHGMFQQIKDLTLRKTLDPDGNYGISSQAYSYENRGEKGNVSLSFDVSQFQSSNFKPGISLIILKNRFRNYVSDDESKISIFSVEDGQIKPEGVITNSNQLPQGGFESDLIFKTWSKYKGHSADIGIQVELTNLQYLENVYFVVTSYRISKDIGNKDTSCESEAPEGTRWWDCNTGKPSYELVCLNWDLTCNDLPNCADTSIPNPDEDCKHIFDFQDALELLLYTLAIILTIIIIAGVIKCIVNRSCGSRAVETSQFVREYLRAGSIDRPLNAPPTYDDAMKNVNEAFSYEGEETPPLYSPLPQEGEELCNPFTLPQTQELTNPQIFGGSVATFPDSSDSSNQDSLETTTTETNSRALFPSLFAPLRWLSFRSNTEENANTTEEDSHDRSLPAHPPAYTEIDLSSP